MIAILFCDPKGSYSGIPELDLWPEERDARLYDGPWPVIAHPPCARWCRLAGFVERVHGYKRGEDGGCFASALESVRKWGGVLEHPAWSKAWERYELTTPPKSGWSLPDEWGGCTARVEQGLYGHQARKGTWLYAVRTNRPALKWGRGEMGSVEWRCTATWTRSVPDRPRLGSKAASSTPPEFRDLLIEIARSTKDNHE